MYSGEYRITIDDRGRIRIPTKFREKLGDDFLLCAGSDGCLLLLKEEELKNLVDAAAEKENKLSLHEKNNELRKFLSTAYRVEEDNQKRFVLPAKLKRILHAEKKLVFLGMITRIEIWAEEVYDKICQYDPDDMNSIIDSLGI